MSATADESAKSCIPAYLADTQLVQEVRRHPALYDPRKRGYKDGETMDKLWLDIANELGMRPLDAKNRWRSLRDKFVREKKRLVLDGEASYRSRDPWPLLDDMSFLWDFINHRKDVYTKKMGPKVRAEYIQRNLQQLLPQPSPEWVSVEFDTPEASPSHANQLTNSELMYASENGNDIELPRIKRDPGDRDNYDEDGPPTSRLRSLLDQTHQDESNEEIQHFSAHPELPLSQKTSDEEELFCLSVAASLRRFSPQKKALAKLRIQQVLYDVEFLQQMSKNTDETQSKSN